MLGCVEHLCAVFVKQLPCTYQSSSQHDFHVFLFSHFIFLHDIQFTFLLRRHHCRICGKVFCRNCSFCRVRTTLQKRPVRACTPCYDFVHKTVFDNDSIGCVEMRIEVNRGDPMEPLDFVYSIGTNEKYGGTEVTIDVVKAILSPRSSMCSLDEDGGVESSSGRLMAGDRVLCINGVNVSLVPPGEVAALFDTYLLKMVIERPPDPSVKIAAATNHMERLIELDRAQQSGSSMRYVCRSFLLGLEVFWMVSGA